MGAPEPFEDGVVANVESVKSEKESELVSVEIGGLHRDGSMVLYWQQSLYYGTGNLLEVVKRERVQHPHIPMAMRS